MNRITDYPKLVTDITNWIKQYALNNNIKSLVVGVSGGIDSAVVSTLCAMTGIDTIPCSIDIDSNQKHLNVAWKHIEWLQDTYENCSAETIDLTNTLNELIQEIDESNQHSLANTKSRMRMMTLYHIAGCEKGIVVGTGNKVEDFGIGFFSKHGDGGVDISPIADLYKTEVRELGRYLGVSKEIINAKPTDGLWGENQRTDEEVIGATYEELEWMMENELKKSPSQLTDRQREVAVIYGTLHNKNLHKIQPIPIYKLTF